MNEVCTVCGREKWGHWQPLGFGHWRHAECEPGSKAWQAYFLGLPVEKRTEEGVLLYTAIERGV